MADMPGSVSRLFIPLSRLSRAVVMLEPSCLHKQAVTALSGWITDRSHNVACLIAVFCWDLIYCPVWDVSVKVLCVPEMRM